MLIIPQNGPKRNQYYNFLLILSNKYYKIPKNKKNAKKTLSFFAF